MDFVTDFLLIYFSQSNIMIEGNNFTYVTKKLSTGKLYFSAIFGFSFLYSLIFLHSFNRYHSTYETFKPMGEARPDDNFPRIDMIQFHVDLST